MNDLKTGDVLTRVSDQSKWRFIHYKPVQIFSNTTDDKNFVHVDEWNNEKQDWKDWDEEGGHQEFPTSEFVKE